MCVCECISAFKYLCIDCVRLINNSDFLYAKSLFCFLFSLFIRCYIYYCNFHFKYLQLEHICLWWLWYKVLNEWIRERTVRSRLDDDDDDEAFVVSHFLWSLFRCVGVVPLALSIIKMRWANLFEIDTSIDSQASSFLTPHLFL